MCKTKIIALIYVISISISLGIISSVNAQNSISTGIQVPLDKYYIKAYLLSEITTLYPDRAFGLRYFPDLPVTVIRERDGYPFRMFVVAGNRTCLFEGNSIQTITDVIDSVLCPGDTGEFDNGYVGIGGVHYHGDGIMYAFYHAEDHEDMPDFGFYASIGLAISKDNGLSFKKVGQVITSHRGKNYNAYPNQADKGVAAPACIPIKSKDGNYLYVYYCDHSRVDGRGNPRGVQIFLARAEISSNPPLPGRWYKYYNGRFTQPGIEGLDSPVITAIDKNGADAINPHVVYSNYLDKYIMVYNVFDWEASQNREEVGYSGTYVAYSDDGINWYNHERIISANTIPSEGDMLSWHHAIIWDDSKEQEGLLIYAYSNSWGGWGDYVPHYMVSRRIKFVKTSWLKIDGEKDPFYDMLLGPIDGCLQLKSFCYNEPHLGRIADSDDDLSAKIWTAWDDEWFYLYEEVTDDKVAADAKDTRNNDGIEIIIDPVPDDSTETTTCELRLTALSDADVSPEQKTDNLNNIPPNDKQFARKITSNGYVLEMAIKWSAIIKKGVAFNPAPGDIKVSTGKEVINPAVGKIFGATLQNHDNDDEYYRHASVQWGAVMSSAAFKHPKYLGTVKFLADNKLQFIPTNNMTGVTNPIPYDGTTFYIRNDGYKDPFFRQLTGPDDGYLQIRSYASNENGAPVDDADLSAKVWTAWDNQWFYLYEEVMDDTLSGNAAQVWEEDEIELKFDPQPTDSMQTSTFEARLTALGMGSPNVVNADSINNVPDTLKQWARTEIADGYALQLALQWTAIKVGTDSVSVIKDSVFGLAINQHDNDGKARRQASIQWAAVMSNRVWNTPKYLGTVQFLENNKFQFIPTNNMTGVTNPTPYDGSDYYPTGN